jgi:L-lactate dehydrogenase complex protein LldG
MTAAREQILARIRVANGGTADPGVARERISRHARQIEPAFDDDLASRFCRKLETAAATVARVGSRAEVVAEVAAYLDAADLEHRLVSSAEGMLQTLEWPASFEVGQHPPSGDDRVGITSALCGIAETGTLMLTSGAGQPTSLNFLPDYHIVVLAEAQLLPRMEDAWDHLRKVQEGMPRTVNFISGPSKTADVEQTVEYGAHGPRCLHVILVA